MKTLKYTILLAVALVAVNGYSQSAANLITEAEKKDAQLDTNGALQLYLQAEKLEPNNPVILIGIAKQHGESMIDKKTKDQKLTAAKTALTYAKKAVASAPKDSDSQLAVAICYGRMLDLVDNKTKVQYSQLVKDHADKAIALNPKSDYAWHMLGRWHMGVANIKPIVRGIAKMVYGELPKGSNAEAVAAFKKAIALKPDRLVHHIELGIALAADGKMKEAKVALQKGLSMPNKERDDPGSKKRGREALAKLK